MVGVQGGLSLEALLAESQKQQEQITALSRENKILRDELAILKKHLFGRKTERLDPGQLSLFLSDVAQEPDKESPQELPKPEKEKKGIERIWGSAVP